MMRLHTRSLIGSALVALMMPVSAAAYVEPEQVLLQDAFINNFTPPPSTRQTDSQVARQAETSKERREREQAEYFAAQRAANGEETLFGAAPDESEDGATDEELTGVLSSLQKTIDELKNQQESTQSQRDQRILDRIAAQQESELLRSGAPLDEFGSGKGTDGKGGDGKGTDGKGGGTINSGAPLNESGPGSWVALGLIVAALWWTLNRAKMVAATVVAEEQPM